MDLPPAEWIVHFVIASVVGFLLVTTIVNAVAMRTLRPPMVRPGEGESGAIDGFRGALEQGDPPAVSVLVPARNEERSIGECLRSLQAQQHPSFEVLMLDDGSGDRTRAIAEDLGFVDAEGATCRLLSGAPLPEGWAGKPWACQQLADAARGRILLFTDADTVHERGAVASAEAELQRTGAGLLSAWPRQVTLTWAERLVVPLLYLLGASLLPVVAHGIFRRRPGLLRRFPSWARMLFGGANGQFLLFERETYRRIGGHRAVSSHLVEDVALSRLVMDDWGRGGPGLHNCDGGLVVRCRMYRSAAEVWSGFSKNVRPLFERNPAGFILAGSLVGLALLGPFVLVPFSSGVALRLCLVEIAAIYGIRALLAIRFRSSWWGALWHPIGFAIGVAIALNSWIRTATGTVEWKGRRYRPFADAASPATRDASMEGREGPDDREAQGEAARHGVDRSAEP